MAAPNEASPIERRRGLAALCLDMTAQGRILSAPWRNALFALFIGGTLAYGAAFAWYMLAHFDLVNLIRDISHDDSFYYFQIAYHMAEGKFSTFDGGITRTNGYHPIWLFLITPFYWTFDKEAALFAIKAFEIMLVAGGVALIAVAARLARLPWYLLFVTLPALYGRWTLIMGMEAAAALFMLGLFILAACLFAKNPARWQWLLAAVAFALPWVRLEYIAISLGATVALCLVERSWQGRPSGTPLGAQVRSVSSLKAFVPLLGAVAGILVYFAYNGIVFGGIVPVSGAVKQVWSQRRWEAEGGYSLTKNFQEILQLRVFDHELLVALEVCILFLLVWRFSRRSRSREDWLLLAFLAGVLALSVGHLAKFAQTVLTMHPRWASYSWYFVPAYLMNALIVPVNCYAAIYFIRRFIAPRSRRAADILGRGIVVVAAVFLLATANFASPFQRVETRSIETKTGDGWGEVFLGFLGGTYVMDRVLPEGSIVGSWDSGVVGYFSRFPVVNLDGMVNSYDYMRAHQAGTVAAFHRHYGITHFARNQHVDRRADTLLFEGPRYPHPSGDDRRFRLWSATPLEDSDAAARFWERMEPHFDDLSSGVGLLVDGRLAQTFARQCDPEELVMWSWAGPGDETVANAWTQTQTGLCITVRVLPHAASGPIRIETMPASDWLAGLTGGGPPVIRSDWDVYLVEDSLIYIKEKCGPEDTQPKFFLHLDPVDADDLPSHRKLYGFDNLDFAFRHYDPGEGIVCITKRELPDYDIAAIRTGQFILGEGRIWKGSFDLAEPADDGQAAP